MTSEIWPYGNEYPRCTYCNNELKGHPGVDWWKYMRMSLNHPDLMVFPVPGKDAIVLNKTKEYPVCNSCRRDIERDNKERAHLRRRAYY